MIKITKTFNSVEHEDEYGDNYRDRFYDVKIIDTTNEKSADEILELYDRFQLEIEENEFLKNTGYLVDDEEEFYLIFSMLKHFENDATGFKEYFNECYKKTKEIIKKMV